LRIAFDIAALDMGGAERQTLEVATGLAELGKDVLLIVNKHAQHFGDYHRALRITELGRMQRFDPRVGLDIRRALRAFRPDVCICVLFNASLWGRLAALSIGCPVLVAEHSTKLSTSTAERLTNIALGPSTRAVVACAEAQVEALVRGGHPRHKIRVIRNGVDVGRFRPYSGGGRRLRATWDVPAKAPLLMLAAAHRREKRQDRFVAAVEHLHERGCPAYGVMVGGGPLLEQSRALAAASPVSSSLRVVGPVTDMTAAYSAADVVLLVSDDVETFPLSFLEAQACAVPVVGMSTGGVAETVIDGETGVIVPQGDLDELTSVTAALLADGDRRTRMGVAGRSFVSTQLTRQVMVQRYADLLASISDAGHATGSGEQAMRR
jgi:glycosyltransferase involved in cell wall biosynthesis